MYFDQIIRGNFWIMNEIFGQILGKISQKDLKSRFLATKCSGPMRPNSLEIWRLGL